MRHASLFSGIGCGDLAAEWMGWENVFQVEIDPFCQCILTKRFPHTEKFTDIYQFNGSQFNGSIDIISGGFPCQKYSQAGFRTGDEPLAKEMLRVVAEIRPTYVVAENVYGFYTIDKGASLQAFCSDLQAIGYEEPAVLDAASDFAGLQTMERHIWIISKANGIGLKRDKQIKIQSVGQDKRKFQGTGSGIGIGRDIRESRFCGVGERTSRRLDKFGRGRLKAIGNGFPPQVAFEIFKAIEQTI
jgi:DNA-cytosine methyltransferase